MFWSLVMRLPAKTDWRTHTVHALVFCDGVFASKDGARLGGTFHKVLPSPVVFVDILALINDAGQVLIWAHVRSRDVRKAVSGKSARRHFFS